MQLHELKRNTANKKKKRVGRGGTRGKTSGRGHKGQKARAGGSPRPAMRDIIKKLPKRRGYGKNRPRTVNPDRSRYVGVNLGSIDKAFSDGDSVTPKSILEKGLVSGKKKSNKGIKILGSGNLSKKCTFEGCVYSAGAREKIEKAGGTIKEK